MMYSRKKFHVSNSILVKLSNETEQGYVLILISQFETWSISRL